MESSTTIILKNFTMLIQKAREYLPPCSVDLVLYHKNCIDGSASSFVAMYYNKTSLGTGVECIAQAYGDPIPDVTNRRVLIVDFSYKRPILLELKKKAQNLIVLDHHKSAKEDLEGLEFAFFDMNRSGAMLAWHYFFGEESPVPKFIEYVQDRDIWTWKLPYSKEFSAAFEMVPMNYKSYLEYIDNNKVQQAIENGKILLEHQNFRVENNARMSALRTWTVNGKSYQVHVINLMTDTSELGNYLSQNSDFAVIWKYDYEKKKIAMSFRSSDRIINGQKVKSVDVSQIASYFGGGGHEKAAACAVDWISFPSELL